MPIEIKDVHILTCDLGCGARETIEMRIAPFCEHFNMFHSVGCSYDERWWLYPEKKVLCGNCHTSVKEFMIRQRTLNEEKGS